MNLIISLIYLFLGVQYSIACEKVIDLKKFKYKALSEITKNYGPGDIFGEGKILYQDGVGSIGLEPLFDYSSLNFEVQPHFPMLEAGQTVSYRLFLIGGEEVMITRFLEDIETLAFYFPEQIIAIFNPKMTLSKQKLFIKKLKTKYPKVEMTHLEQINMMTLQGGARELITLGGELNLKGEIQEVFQDQEVYRVPFKFDKVKTIDSETQTLEVESVRSLSRYYRDLGYRFIKEACIPEDLR